MDGNNGDIAQFIGSIWNIIESGTTSIIIGVWGIRINQNKTVIYCPDSSFFVSGDKKILKIVDVKVDSVNWNRDLRLYSVQTKNENFLYVCGEGIFKNKSGAWNEIKLPTAEKNLLRGYNINDIFIDGNNVFIAHFNGSTWQIYNNSYPKGYSRLDFKSNIAVIAVSCQGKAILEIAIRN